MDQVTQHAITRARAALDVAAAGPGQRALADDHLRAVIARAVAAGDEEAFAAGRWGKDSRAVRIVKAGVAAVGSDDVALADAARAAFFQQVVEQTVLGRMTRARRVGFNSRHLAPAAGARGYWAGEGNPVPLSRFTLEGTSLQARKAGALIVLANETLVDPSSEEQVRADITRAVVLAVDEAVLDGGAGTDHRPAALTVGAASETSTGAPGADLAALVEAFEGDLDAAILVTDPVTAAQAALAGGALFQGLGARGGEVIGLPVLTSRASPRTTDGGQWTLIDQAGIAVALEGLTLARSTAGTIWMSDDPEAEPTAVSLFQNELVGLLATLRANWAPVRDGAVAVVTGAAYTVAT